ncbi:MAG: hypothetical protein KF782_29550 [Labilithrix sp.]|nr:hypothetical protein [Labilithrix sp.]
MRFRIVALLLAVGCSSSGRAEEASRLIDPTPADIDAGVAVEQSSPDQETGTLAGDDGSPSVTPSPFGPRGAAKVYLDGVGCPFPASTCPAGCTPYSTRALDEADQCIEVVLGCVAGVIWQNGTSSCAKRLDDGLLIEIYGILPQMRDDWTTCTADEAARWRARCRGR